MSANKEYVADRNFAIRSMDETKIKAFMEKWLIMVPAHPELFWRMVHKTRFHLQAATLAEKMESQAWLEKRGSNTDVA